MNRGSLTSGTWVSRVIDQVHGGYDAKDKGGHTLDDSK